MGLVDFATAVMVSYLAFLPDSWSSQVVDALCGGPVSIRRLGSAWQSEIRITEGTGQVGDTGWPAVVRVLGRLPLTTPLVP